MIGLPELVSSHQSDDNKQQRRQYQPRSLIGIE